MRGGILFLCTVALSSCGSVDVPPVTTGEACHRCDRPVVEPRLAARILDAEGTVMTFRTVACLSRFLAEREDLRLRAVLVTDYPSGRFLPVGNASFLRVPIDEATGEEDYLAFRGLREAVEFGREHRAHPLSWEVVRVQVAQQLDPQS
jgi:hypothetical protein